MDMGEALVYIADKLGVATTQLLEIYRHGVVVSRIGSIVALVFWIVSLYVAGKKYMNWLDTLGDNDDDNLIIGTLGFIVIILALTLLSFEVKDIIVALFAPDYAAVQELISQLGHMAR